VVGGAPWHWVGLLALAGCGPSLSALDATERAQHQRIEQLDAQIKADEARADRAKARADYESCKAQTALIMASAASKVAKCNEAQARASECNAKNESTTADSGLAGCALGFLVTAVTAGAGSWALAGCGAGLLAGHAAEKDCTPAACDASPNGAIEAALHDHGASMLPLCGGVVGVTLIQEPRGVAVAQVDGAGPAAGSGVQPGDILLGVNGTRISNLGDAATALRDMPGPGDPVQLVGARGGQVFTLQLVLAPRRAGQLGL
jgi:hypothetical protein